jgi:uncharacterized membrane protein
LALFVMAVGIAMRLRFYLYNRSMYRDEAALALNIVGRSFRELFKPLDNDQGAPVGFLLAEKLIVKLLGNHEYALRLLPVTASILALPIFYLLARKLLTGGGAVIALVILAMGEKQYDYSCETKQYSTDVFATVLLLYLAMKALGNPARGEGPSKRAWLVLAGAGALAIWFSHPAIFVLAAIGVMALMQWVTVKPRFGIFEPALAAVLWAGSFAANYVLVLRRLSHSDFMQTFWAKADAFAPIPTSMKALIWYKEQFFDIFESPTSLGFVGLAALVFVLGLGVLFKRRKSAALAVILPVILTLAASLLRKYPFKERLILFIVPLLAIFIGGGFEYLFEKDRRKVGIIALIFLLITPLNKTREFIKKPFIHSDMRTAMTTLKANRQPDDQFYVFEFCYYPFEYYKDRFGMGQVSEIRGKPDVAGMAGYKEIFTPMKGKRVWILFEDAPDLQQSAVAALDEMGKRVYEGSPYDDYVACYDLR